MEPEGSLPRLQVPATCPHSWARSIQFMAHPHPTSWRSILMINSHLCLGLPSGLVPSVSPPRHCMHLSCPYMCYMPHQSHSWFDHPNNIHYVVFSIIWRMHNIWSVVDLLHRNPRWWSPVISSAYGINFYSWMSDKVLYVADKSGMSLLLLQFVLSPCL